MAYTKYAYIRVNWKNKSESLETPLGKSNLNRMDEGLYVIAENIDVVYNELEAKKVDVSSASKMLRSAPVWDKNTGILTFQFYDGTEYSIDFNIEKIPVSFSMDSSGVITMKTADGTKWTADIGDMIPDYTFEDSDRITFTRTKNSDGSYKITADIVKGSITGDYLEPNYLANVTTQASKAEAGAKSASQSADDAAYDAKLAQSYSIGGSGIRDGESTSNAKYYSEEAKKAAEEAQAVAGGDFIPSSQKGVAGGVATLNDNGVVPLVQLPHDAKRKYCMVGSDVANAAGWYKVAEQTMSGYSDANVTFKVTSTYGNYYLGTLELQMRHQIINQVNILNCKNLKWSNRIGFPTETVICVIDGSKYTIYAYQSFTQYGRIMFEIISESSIGNGLSGITLYNSDTPESTEPVATVVSTDGATVLQAIQDGNGNNIVDIYATKDEVDEVKKSGSDWKSAIASAITEKGVSTDADDTKETFVSNIEAIETGIDTSDATAAAKYIVKGYTAYANGTKLVGTLPDRSHVSKGAEGVVGLEAETYPNVAVSPYDGAVHWRTNTDGVKRFCLQAPYGVYGGAGNKGGLSGDGYVGIEVEAFGDAEASDVAEGVTFTSKNGLKLKGTATFSKETKIVKFTTSTTWTIPEGVTSIDVCCVGGGQGSGGSGTGGGASQGGRGGDGGKVYYKTGISVTPGTSYAITVGAGGAGLAATSTSLTYQKAGSDGGNSTFGSLVSSASATTRKSGGQGWAAGGTSSGMINSTAVAGINGVYAFNDVTVDGILYGGSGAGGTSGSFALSGGESGGGNSGVAGTANTGGGAGGRRYSNGATYAGLSGGSGIVIVRYQI